CALAVLAGMRAKISAVEPATAAEERRMRFFMSGSALRSGRGLPGETSLGPQREDPDRSGPGGRGAYACCRRLSRRPKVVVQRFFGYPPSVSFHSMSTTVNRASMTVKTVSGRRYCVPGGVHR